MKNSKIVEIVNLYDEFSATNRSEDLREFALWLLRSQGRRDDLTLINSKPAPVKEGRNKEESGKPRSAEESEDTDRNIAYLFNRIAKYSRFYTKKELAEFGLNSIDEFYFLLSIGRSGSPTKSEVYFDTITELTTGAQIMKRLIKQGYVEETTDKNDKRAKRVRLTKKGEKIKGNVFNKLSESIKLKTGNLPQHDKDELLRMLSYIAAFHSHIYKTESDKSVGELVNKYLD
ncbi:MAG: winged helix-turn-helix transcriptional regulator [Ignavibacteriaceae bacterium]|nr:winged helix-turn-helix transcriptional regulator [Ignavibacteriaceae bacterium]